MKEEEGLDFLLQLQAFPKLKNLRLAAHRVDETDAHQASSHLFGVNPQLRILEISCQQSNVWHKFYRSTVSAEAYYSIGGSGWDDDDDDEWLQYSDPQYEARI